MIVSAGDARLPADYFLESAPDCQKVVIRTFKWMKKRGSSKIYIKKVL